MEIGPSLQRFTQPARVTVTSKDARATSNVSDNQSATHRCEGTNNNNEQFSSDLH